MNKSLNTLLHKAIIAAVEAGKEILSVYETDFGVQYKGDDTPLTLADQRASDKIIRELASSDIPVLSEEGEHFAYDVREKLDHLWIVDPLDGTKEFVKRNGEFTVNIALVFRGRPILGVIYSPVFKDLYFALDKTGSFKIDRHDFIAMSYDFHGLNLEQLIRMAKRLPLKTYPETYTIVASRSHMSKETYAYIEKLKQLKGEVNIVNTGSSIKMCWVAEGIAHEYPRFGPTMEWDTAAGQAILENAGCELIDFEAQLPILYNRVNLTNPWFVARKA